MTVFVIKHRSGGRYIHPLGGDLNPSNDTRMVVHQDIHAGMHFAFDRTRNGYGYIRHVGSGKYIRPRGGNLNPSDKTDLVLHQERHAGALFYIDTRNHHIRHHGGKYIHTKGGHPNPGNQNPLVLRGGRHAAMEFVIVSPCNTNQENHRIKEAIWVEAMTTFVIKHKTSGKFIHPLGGSLNSCDQTALVLHQDVHAGMHFAFDKTCNDYGYIRHVGSGKCIHPNGGSCNPCNETCLVLHGDRHNGALFRIDTCNKRIQHYGGKYIHPKGGQANPCNNNKMVLHGDIHERMEFLIVSPCNTCQEVCP